MNPQPFQLDFETVSGEAFGLSPKPKPRKFVEITASVQNLLIGIALNRQEVAPVLNIPHRELNGICSHLGLFEEEIAERMLKQYELTDKETAQAAGYTAITYTYPPKDIEALLNELHQHKGSAIMVVKMYKKNTQQLRGFEIWRDKNECKSARNLNDEIRIGIGIKDGKSVGI